MGGKNTKPENNGMVNNVIVSEITDTVSVEYTKDLYIIVVILLGIVIVKVIIDWFLKYRMALKERYQRRAIVQA